MKVLTAAICSLVFSFKSYAKTLCTTEGPQVEAAGEVVRDLIMNGQLLNELQQLAETENFKVKMNTELKNSIVRDLHRHIRFNELTSVFTSRFSAGPVVQLEFDCLGRWSLDVALTPSPAPPVDR
jgi:hypothetical protein